jgi:hypothetical protein
MISIDQGPKAFVWKSDDEQDTGERARPTKAMMEPAENHTIRFNCENGDMCLLSSDLVIMAPPIVPLNGTRQ